MNQTLITGMGVISPAGIGIGKFCDAVFNGMCLLEERADGFCLGQVSVETRQELKENTKNRAPFLRLSENPDTQIFEAHLFTLDATHQAMSQAGRSKLGPEAGVIFATTTGQLPIWENDLVQYVSGNISADELSKTFQHQTFVLTMKQIALAMDFHGLLQLVTSVRAASTQAIALVYWWIKSKKVKQVLVGGAELLCNLTVKGFDYFQILAKEPAKPYDLKHWGINLSEGAAFISLEADDSDSIENEKVLARISGVGISSDAYHMTSPEPSGKGCKRVVESVLEEANLLPSQIDWIHAHGTGSSHNDVAESAALSACLGEGAPVSSTKGVHGHPLAIAGALEVVLDVFALRNGIRLGTKNYFERDNQIKLRVVREREECDLKHVVKTTLGFGGANGSLVLSRADQRF